MAFHWPTFLTRAGSAIVFGIIMLTGLLWHEWAFLALAALIQVLCLHEYIRLVRRIQPDAYWPQALPWVLQLSALLLLLAVYGSQSAEWNIGRPVWPVLLWVPAFMLAGLALMHERAWQTALQVVGGLCYISLSVALLLCLRLQDAVLPLALIILIWVNDTMAYIVGSLMGKTPFSTISPKKTWEGTAGGALLTMAVAAVWGWLSDGQYALIHWVMLALCAAVAGTVGDLLESRLKRMAGVKDSGNMMPGHGGALDRFDSLLLAAPFAFCYAYAFM
jgi:phosphatidate cytidylyltransferase